MDDNSINGLSEDELRDIVAYNTTAEAAKIIGITPSAVSRLLTRFGLAGRGRGKGNPVPTLCWHCKNSTNGNACPWARDFTPVPGWTAKPSLIQCARNYEQLSFHSVCVQKCPLFDEDERDPAGRICATNSIKEKPTKKGESTYENH